LHQWGDAGRKLQAKSAKKKKNWSRRKKGGLSKRAEEVIEKDVAGTHISKGGVVNELEKEGQEKP